MWGAMVHVVETVADIVDEQSFREARSHLRLLLEVSPTHFLPDADTLFRMALGVTEDSDEVRRGRQLAEMIADAESLADLDLDFEAARRQREEHGRAFLVPMREVMIPSIQPRADTSDHSYNIRLPAAELQRFRDFLFSDAGRREVTRGWMARQGWDRMALPSRLWDRAHEVLEAYYQTYRGYAVNLFERSLKPRANDALDLDLTLALWEPCWLFVSGDKRLRHAMMVGGVPANKFADVGTLDPAILDMSGCSDVAES